MLTLKKGSTMSYTSRLAPVGRFYSTVVDQQLQRLTTKENDLRYRIDNQIQSLLATASALNTTQKARRSIVALTENKAIVEGKIAGLEQQISHKEFLYPEETSLVDQQKLGKLEAQLAHITSELEKLSVKKV